MRKEEDCQRERERERERERQRQRERRGEHENRGGRKSPGKTDVPKLHAYNECEHPVVYNTGILILCKYHDYQEIRKQHHATT